MENREWRNGEGAFALNRALYPALRLCYDAMRIPAIYLLALAVSSAPALQADEPLLRPGDRVALLGGTFVERMQASGAFEAELQARRPDWELSFRNIGWSGDDVHGIARKRFDRPEDGFQRMLQDVETSKANVVLIGYGFSEASDGPNAVERFGPGLQRLIGELKSPQRRIILLTPVAMPGVRVAGYEDSIERVRDVIRHVGQETGLPVLEIDWAPEAPQLTANRLLPNEQGYGRLANLVGDRLVGGGSGGRDREALRHLVVDKNQLFFHRYRPQNETYLFLFRKHEQGNNSVEIPQFDPLIEAADEAIWKAAKTGS